ncbi:MAG: hypothetical protein VX641_03380 [Planctomycetota bacterium]|nr:hypothetical protein [Planctomycetota bacterium]
MTSNTYVLGFALGAFLASGAQGAQNCDEDLVGFEGGSQGWIGTNGSTGGTQLEATGGNPGHHLHTVFNDFGIEFTNDTRPDEFQNLLGNEEVTIQVDLKVEAIDFFGTPATRPWVLEIRDYDNAPPGFLWVSVWYLFEWVGAEGDWRTFEVTISDTTASELPPGWGGTGAEPPPSYEPTLPADRTFASVLAGADEIAFTTYQPGWVFGFTNFDVRFDNVRITGCSVPECPGDLDDDAGVDGKDLARLLAAWGICAKGCPEDFDGNGIVDGADLSIILAYWGTCPR